MISRRNVLAGAAGFGAAGLLASPARVFAQSAKTVRISRQLGVLYVPTHVMETQKLIEKHAERLGLPGLTVEWMSFANSSAQQDALLSGAWTSSTRAPGRCFCCGTAPGAASRASAPVRPSP